LIAIRKIKTLPFLDSGAGFYSQVKRGMGVFGRRLQLFSDLEFKVYLAATRNHALAGLPPWR